MAICSPRRTTCFWPASGPTGRATGKSPAGFSFRRSAEQGRVLRNFALYCRRAVGGGSHGQTAAVDCSQWDRQGDGFVETITVHVHNRAASAAVMSKGEREASHLLERVGIAIRWTDILTADPGRGVEQIRQE